MAAEVGLQPSCPLAGVPFDVIVGAVMSTVHVTVREVVAVLPQASVAVNVLVCVRVHPVPCGAPVDEVTVGVPHASVEDAEPSEPSIAADEGLQPSVKLPPVAVIVGAVLSLDHCTVRDVAAVLPQASVAVNVLVCDFTQSPVMPLVLEVTVAVPQASVAVAEPSAASICAVDGLHKVNGPAPVAVIVGAVRSAVHVAVRDVVAVFPHASVAVNVRVCERKHPLL